LERFLLSLLKKREVMKKLMGVLTGSLLFIGCATGTTTYKRLSTPVITPIKPTNKTQKCIVDNRLIPNCILVLESEGKGVVPCNGSCSTAQAKMMARRSAIVAAYRNLAEKMYGIKINGRDTVKNMVLKNSTIRAYVEGLIRGANIVDEDYKDGIYSVVLNLKLDVRKWNEFLKNCKTCSSNTVANYF
jgi:hypothetical protein